MTDYAAVLEHAKAGTLTELEVRDVVAQLRSGVRDHPQRYRIVLAAGWACLRDAQGGPRGAALDPDEVRPFIESLLGARSDPWLVREALGALCSYLPGEGRYRDRLRDWVHPLDWDEENDVRTVAISALGDLIRTSGVADGVDDLLQLAEDPEDDMSDWALRALARATGRAHSELPGTRGGMRSRPELVERVMADARRLRGSGGAATRRG